MTEVIFKSLHIVRLVAFRALPILFVVTYLQERGFLSFLDKFARKLVAKTAFGTVTGKAFMANVGSAYAGGGMLVNMFKQGRISRTNLILSVVFASFPGYIRILLTSTGPVMLSLFTLPVAMFYIFFSIASAVTRVILAGSLSHMLLKKEEIESLESIDTQLHKQETRTNGKAAKIALRRTLRYAVKLVVFVTVVTSIVFYLNQKGIFQKIPLNVNLIGLTENYNVALYTYMGNAYAGMGVISDFSNGGGLGIIDTIKLLLFCMLCSRPIIAIKESPSYYLGLFGLKTGLLILLFNLSIFFTLGLSVLIGLNILF